MKFIIPEDGIEFHMLIALLSNDVEIEPKELTLVEYELDDKEGLSTFASHRTYAIPVKPANNDGE